jgi:CheY-like chemotaxis protein
MLVNNGREAIEKLAGESFDLLLLDCHMPVMDGFDVICALRKQEENT